MRMQGPLWNKVSLEAKQLIQSLMAFDPGARLTIDKVQCSDSYAHCHERNHEKDGKCSTNASMRLCLVFRRVQ